MKHRIIQDKGKWAYVVEDGNGNEVSRKGVKDQEAAEKARQEAFDAAQAETAGTDEDASNKPAKGRKAATGDKGETKVEPTREAVTEEDLPGETTTNAQAPVEDEKKPAPQSRSTAEDAGRAPPPVREKAVRTTNRKPRRA